MPDTAVALVFEQRVGALDRIVGLLRRRGFPIGGITVERTHRSELGRMTIVVQQPEAVEQITRHLSRLPDVVEVVAMSDLNAVRREYLLARVRCEPTQRAEVMALLVPFGARAISVTADCLVIEVAGDGATLDAFLAELDRYGIEESARTNPMALHRSMERQTA